MLQQDQNRPEIFVGREYEQEQYKEILEGQETYWILFFIGMPGIGKSTLLRQLKEHTPTDVGIIHLDFQENYPYLDLLTDPLQVLEALATEAKRFCNENQYNTFMTTLREERERLKQKVLSDEQEIYKNVQSATASAFYAYLDTLEKKRLVFMLDTCELLNEPEGWMVGQWLIGELLPALHERMDQLDRRCLVVIASRVPLESEVIREQDQLCIDLSMLTRTEVNEYLEKAGMDIVKWQERVYEMTSGHPLSLSIVHELPSSDDDENITTLFDEKVSIKFVEERILGRLKSPFKELTEYAVLPRSFDLPQLQQTISPDLLPRSKANDVFNQFIRYPYVESKGGYRYTFHEFVREVLAKYTQRKQPKEWLSFHRQTLAFFTPKAGEPRSPEWYYHSIALAETEGIQAWKEAMQEARTGGNSKSIGSLLQIARDKALNLTLISQLTLSEEEERFYIDKGQSVKAAERRKHAEKLRQETERLREKAKGLEAQGDNQQKRGDSGLALQSYSEALQLFQQIGNHSKDEARLLSLVEKLRQEIGEKAKELEVKGNDHRQHGDLGAALESYNEAIKLFQQIGNRSEDEDRLLNLVEKLIQEIKRLREKANGQEAKGDDQRQKGDLSLALMSYDEALKLYQQIGNHSEDVARLQRVRDELKKEIDRLREKAEKQEAKGNGQRQEGDLSAALESYKEAIKLFRQIGNHSEDVARLQRVRDEIEQLLEARATTRDDETISPSPVPSSTGVGVPNRGILRVPISLLTRRPLLAVSISLLIIALLLILIFTPILQAIIPNHISLQLPPGIGITQSSNGESIGISNGASTFNGNCQTDNTLKCQAAEQLRQGDINGAKSLWNRELAVNANDAEALIYLENQRVQDSPHITLVVATTLTGPTANLGQDNLQGAYVAQKEFNDGFKLPNGRKVLLLIANFGSNPKDATTIAKQIVQAAQADKTIVGIMGLPLSSYVPDAMTILRQAQLPLISPTASSDELTGISPFFFRTVPPNEVQARVGADYAIHTLYAHTAALFYDPHDSSSNGLAKDFERYFTDLGGITREKTYTTGKSETLRLQLKDILDNPSDLLYFAGSATDMGTVLINLPSSSNLQIMGGNSLYQLQDYSTTPHLDLTRLHFTAFAYPGEWNSLCSTGLSQACFQPPFFTIYPQAFDDGNHQQQPYGHSRANSDTIVSYDALSLLLTAYQRALSHGQTLQVALNAITGTQAFQGVSGQIAFGADGNPLNKAVVLLSLGPDGDVKLASTNGIQGCFLINACTNP